MCAPIIYYYYTYKKNYDNKKFKKKIQVKERRKWPSIYYLHHRRQYDLYTTDAYETTTLTKTAYQFTSHSHIHTHNNDNMLRICVYGYGDDRTTTHNFQRKWTINLHHTRASIEAIRYEIYIRIMIITIIMNNTCRINITIKHNDDDSDYGHEIIHYWL